MTILIISLVLNLPFLSANKRHPPLSKKAGKSSHKRTSRPSEGELRQKRTSIGDWSSKEGGVSSKGEMPSKRDWASKGSSKGEDWPSKGSSKGGDDPSKGSPEGDWPSKRGSVSSEGPF